MALSRRSGFKYALYQVAYVRITHQKIAHDYAHLMNFFKWWFALFICSIRMAKVSSSGILVKPAHARLVCLCYHASGHDSVRRQHRNGVQDV